MTRIVIKADYGANQASRGCILTLEHLRNPKVMRILDVAAETAPLLVDGEMLVSEGWRNIRDTPDAHERYEAFDISLSTVEDKFGNLEITGTDWCERMQAKLGDDYFVMCHGEGANLHIHAQIRKPR